MYYAAEIHLVECKISIKLKTIYFQTYVYMNFFCMKNSPLKFVQAFYIHPVYKVLYILKILLLLYIFLSCDAHIY